MAQALEILIKVKSLGQVEIDQINSKLAKLKTTLSESNFAPLLQLGRTIKDIGKNVEVLTVTTKKTIDTVIEQASRKVIETVDSTSRHAGKALEITFVRFSAIIASGIGIKAAGSVLGLARLFSNSLGRSVDIVATKVSEIPRSISLISGVISTAGFGSEYLAKTAELAYKFFSAGAITIGIFPFILNETLGLVRRLRGETASSISPIQHAVSLVSLLDSTLRSSFVTVRGIITGILGSGLGVFLLGIQNSILIIPAALNIIFGFVTSGIRRIGINIFTALGSGRAAFAKIFFDLREILLRTLPTVLIISREFAKLGQAKGFSLFGIGNRQEAPIKGIIQQIKDLPNTLTKFQEFFGKTQNFAKELAKDIAEIRHNLDQTPKSKILSPLVNRAGEILVTPQKTLQTDFVRKAAQEAVASLERVKQAESQLASTTIKTAEEIKVSLGTILLTVLSQRKNIEESRVKFQLLFQSLADFSKKKVDFSAVQKSLADFLKTLQAQAPELKDKIDRLLTTTTQTPNAKNIGNSLRAFVREISEAQNLTKRVGNNITQILSEAIEKDVDKVVKASEKLVQAFIDFYPNSPAKRGPLRFLPQMGQKIVTQLSGGMLGAKKTAEDATRRVAEAIADYFPQSPAKVGPLRNLFGMGLNIIDQLVLGIKSGIGSLVNITAKIGSEIKATIERSAKIGDISIRTGLSIESLGPIQNALAEVNLNVDDLAFSFVKINEALRQAFTPEESAKIRALGVDIEQIRETGDPVLALFLRLADVVQKFGAQSIQAKQVLELLGQTANTNLLVLLEKGSAGIKELLRQGAELGFVYEGSVVKISQSLRGLLNRFELLKNFIVDAFITEVLPSLQRLNEELTALFIRNRAKIFGMIRLISSTTLELIATLKNFAIFAFENPAKSLEILAALAGSTFNFLLTISEQIFEALGLKIAIFGRETAVFVFVNTVSFIKNLSGEIIKLLDPLFLKLKAKFLEKYQSFLLDNETLLGALFVDVKGQVRKIASQLVDIDIEARSDSFDFVGAINKTSKDSQAALEKLKESIKQVGEATVSPKLLDSFRAAFSQLSNDLKDSFKGTALETEVKGLIDRLSDLLGKPFEEAQQASQEATQKILGDIDQITQKKQTADKRTILNPDEQIAILRKQFEQELTIQKQLSDIRFRATGDSDSRRQSELIAFEQQQQQEFETLKNAGAKKEELLEAFRLQQIERDKFVLKQWTENLASQLSNVQIFTQGAVDLFSELYELSGQKIKEFFLLSKAAALAQATIKIAEGIATAIGQGGVFGIAQGVLVAAAGSVQIAKILATTIKGFALGGHVQGGSGTKDDVPAMLTAGEFVIPRHAVNRYGVYFFEALRQGVLPKNALSNLMANYPKIAYTPAVPKFASGGLVPKFSSSQQTVVSPTIVNIPDPKLAESYLASTDGENLIVNIIHRNAYKIKPALS